MIVILTNIPTPYRTAFFNQLDLELKKKGSQLHVLYCAKTEPRRFWDFKAEDQHYDYTFLKGFHPTYKHIYAHINFEVLNILKKLKPSDLIIAGAWNTPTMLFSIFLYNSSVKKYFWSEGHQDSQRSGNAIISSFRKSIFRKFKYFFVPNINSLNYITNIRGDSKAKFCLLPNTIDENFFDSVAVSEKSVLRKKYDVDLNSRCIVLVSALVDGKGVMQFLKAFKKFQQFTSRHYTVFFLGTGILKDEMVKFKEENNLKNVNIMGHVDENTVREFLKMSDLFALPTKLDSNPLTPIEASFMQTPLMLSRKAGNFNELLNVKTGIEIGEITEDSILKSLQQLDEIDDEDLKQMGINAYQNVIDNFSRKQVAKNVVEFTENLDLSK